MEQSRHERLKKQNTRLIRNKETMKTKNTQTIKKTLEEINRKDPQTKKEVSKHIQGANKGTKQKQV